MVKNVVDPKVVKMVVRMVNWKGFHMEPQKERMKVIAMVEMMVELRVARMEGTTGLK